MEIEDQILANTTMIIMMKTSETTQPISELKDQLALKTNLKPSSTMKIDTNKETSKIISLKRQASKMITIPSDLGPTQTNNEIPISVFVANKFKSRETMGMLIIKDS